MKTLLLNFYTSVRRMLDSIGTYTLENGQPDNLPKHGVYIFFDQNEPHDGKLLPGRIVRIGTHGVSRDSTTTLWKRLRDHRGYDSGDGNHRGSIFRKHVGAALCRQEQLQPELLAQWKKGSSKPKNAQYDETGLEKLVSEYIRRLPYTVVDIPGASSSTNERAVFEKDAILLLSMAAQQNGLITIGEQWLGRETGVDAITASGLWNVRHVWRSDKPQSFQAPIFTYHTESKAFQGIL